MGLNAQISYHDNYLRRNKNLNEIRIAKKKYSYILNYKKLSPWYCEPFTFRTRVINFSIQRPILTHGTKYTNILYVCLFPNKVCSCFREKCVCVNSAFTFELNLLGGALWMEPKLSHPLNTPSNVSQITLYVGRA